MVPYPPGSMVLIFLKELSSEFVVLTAFLGLDVGIMKLLAEVTRHHNMAQGNLAIVNSRFKFLSRENLSAITQGIFSMPKAPASGAGQVG